MKRILLISLILLAFVPVLNVAYSGGDEQREEKSSYVYAGKISERTVVYDFLQHGDPKLLNTYIKNILIQDMKLMAENDEFLKILAETGYCKVWDTYGESLKGLGESSEFEKISKNLKELCSTKKKKSIFDINR